LCYFAVLENLEYYIYKWLVNVEISEDREQITKRERHIWRGILLRCLFAGHLSADTDRSADPAIQFFWRLVGEHLAAIEMSRAGKASARQEKILSVPQFPATVAIGQALTSGAYWKTSPKLWDEFVTYELRQDQLYDRGELSIRYELFKGPNMTRARFALEHPGDTQPQPMIAFLR
jgi:hypothetical protein